MDRDSRNRERLVCWVVSIIPGRWFKSTPTLHKLEGFFGLDVERLPPYIRWFAHDLKAKGRDAERLPSEIRETPQRDTLRRRFQQ